MSFSDEPFLFPDEDESAAKVETGQEDMSIRIERLVSSQPFGVLCTQGQSQPYGSLVAYAVTDDLAHLTFATPRATRKFRLLSECEHVAVVIDNRPDFPGELMKIEAITATGHATLIEDGSEDFERWTKLLTERHSYLSRFVRASSCALFSIRIVRYIHVCRFQEVRQWIPGSSG